ncbi:hypothetical protein [Aquimarina sp. 2304DJ70-9]|uniref:hypothetical protein n=1 Tax=Aquimarina penaris TaxID=3231044 RepID=UPI0034632F18
MKTRKLLTSIAIITIVLFIQSSTAQEKYFAGNPHDKDPKWREHKIGSAVVTGCCNTDEFTINYNVGDVLSGRYKELDKLIRNYPELPNYYEAEGNVTEFEFVVIEDDGDILAFNYKSGSRETPEVESLIIFKKVKGKSSKKEVEEKKKWVKEFFETKVRKAWADENNEELKKVFLPKPGKMQTSVRAKEVISVLNNREGYNNDYYHAVVLSNDWNIEHHSYTGAIIGRTVTARAVRKGTDGVCRYDTTKFIQEYTGSGYQKNLKYYKATRLTRGVAGNGKIACENVK